MTIFALFFILINVMFFLFLIYWYNRISLQTNLRTYGYYQENLALHNQLHMLKSEHQYQIVTLNNEVKRLNDILELAKQDGNADIIRGAMKMGEVSEAGDE